METLQKRKGYNFPVCMPETLFLCSRLYFSEFLCDFIFVVVVAVVVFFC